MRNGWLDIVYKALDDMPIFNVYTPPASAADPPQAQLGTQSMQSASVTPDNPVSSAQHLPQAC